MTVESDVEHGGSVGAPRRTALLQQEGLGGSGRPGWVAPFVIAAIVGVLVGAGVPVGVGVSVEGTGVLVEVGARVGMRLGATVG